MDSPRPKLSVEETSYPSSAPSSVFPQMFGQPMPAPPPPQVNQTSILKRSTGVPISMSGLKFIIPAILIVIVLAVAGVLIPRYLSSRQVEEVLPPEPTLVPATPVPTIEPLPRSRSYNSLENELSFNYLSSFILVECDQKIIFVTSKPSNPDESCSTEEGTVLKIEVSNREFVLEGDVAYRIQTSSENNYYLVTLLDEKYIQLYDTIINSLKFIDPNLTDGWETYTSESGYSISYPPEWTLISAEEREGAKVTEIRKNVTETKFHNLAIKVTPNVANAGLSASEIISSLQGLSGWKDRPTVEFRVIGGEIAQIIQGEYEGVWKVNVVVWRGTSLVEMTWQDELNQQEVLNFEGLLSTFRFN